MSDSESFLGRSDVKAALDDLVAHRFQLTEEGQTDAELPDAMDYFHEQGIEVPDGVTVRLLRTIHESDVDVLAPVCNGDFARPINCRWIGKRWVCDWVCP